MLGYFNKRIKPLSKDLEELLNSSIYDGFYSIEPKYLVWRDKDGLHIHVESDDTETKYELVDGKLIEKLPF